MRAVFLLFLMLFVVSSCGKYGRLYTQQTTEQKQQIKNEGIVMEEQNSNDLDL